MLAAVGVSAVAFALYTRVEWRWFWLGWVGLAPWLAVVDRCTTVRATLAAAWLMCAAFVVAVFAWFAFAISNYTAWPPALSMLALLAVAPLLQPQFFTLALARRFAHGRAGAFAAAWIGACAYVATEWAWPKLFGDTIGHGFYASPTLRQAADLGGAPALTFVLVLSNQCVCAAYERRRNGANALDAARPLLPIVAIVALLSAYGVVRAGQLGGRRSEPPLRVALVQADLGDYGGMRERLGTYEAVRKILDDHFELSREALARTGVDLVVWPETVYPTTFAKPKSEDGAAFDDEIVRFVDAVERPLVFGAYDSDGEHEFNAAFFLDAADSSPSQAEVYRKIRPFPLTEHVPAWLDSPRVRSVLPWMGTWQPGREARAVDVRLGGGRTLRVAPLICLDAVDPSLAIAAVRDGAEAIVTLSNDGWFSAGNGPRLHLVVSAFRSLETRRPQLRATNTGISAVFSPTGEMSAMAPVGERAALTAEVRPSNATSLMLAWGDWFGPAALVAGLIAAGLVAVGVSRRRDASGP